MSLKKVVTYHGTGHTDRHVSGSQKKRKKNVKKDAVKGKGEKGKIRPTVRYTSPPQPLRIVTLQDRKDLLSLPDARIARVGAILEVDQQRARLLPGGHDVHDPLQHEDQMLDLPLALARVLAPGVEVEARAGGVVEAENDLLARLGLGGDVLGRDGVGAELAAPGERVEQAARGFGWGPVGGAEVAEQALAGEPHALGVCDGGLGRVAGGRDGDVGPGVCDLVQGD